MDHIPIRLGRFSPALGNVVRMKYPRHEKHIEYLATLILPTFSEPQLPFLSAHFTNHGTKSGQGRPTGEGGVSDRTETQLNFKFTEGVMLRMN